MLLAINRNCRITLCNIGNNDSGVAGINCVGEIYQLNVIFNEKNYSNEIQSRHF